MTKMFGFCCWAEAGAAANVSAADHANTTSQIVLNKFISWFLVVGETNPPDSAESETIRLLTNRHRTA